MRAGSASAPCGPSLGCAVAVWMQSAPRTIRAESALKDCMKLPDAAERDGSNPRTEYPRRIKSGHFSVNTASPGRCGTARLCPVNHLRVPPEASSCPLSVHRAGQLMQKIHRLTDN